MINNIEYYKDDFRHPLRETLGGEGELDLQAELDLVLALPLQGAVPLVQAVRVFLL